MILFAFSCGLRYGLLSSHCIHILLCLLCLLSHACHHTSFFSPAIPCLQISLCTTCFQPFATISITWRSSSQALYHYLLFYTLLPMTMCHVPSLVASQFYLANSFLLPIYLLLPATPASLLSLSALPALTSFSQTPPACHPFFWHVAFATVPACPTSFLPPAYTTYM